MLSSASQLAVLNMEGNFGTFLTDDFFLDLLARNPLNKLATLDISFNDQGGVRITLELGSSVDLPKYRMFASIIPFRFLVVFP